MEKLQPLKWGLCSGVGALGGFFVHLIGGWTGDLATLVTLMAVDFVSGLLVAASCKSPKTESGGLSSSVSWKGLLKKIMSLLIVVVAHQMDRLLGVDYIRTAAIIAFCANEGLSLVENAALLGVPMLPVITKAIDILKGKSDGNDKEDQNEKRN